MTVDQIIEKINELELIQRRTRITEPMIMAEMVRFAPQVYKKEESVLRTNGYYAMVDNVPTFVSDENWYTYKLPVTTTYSTPCTCNKFFIEGDILFVINKVGGAKQYVSVKPGEILIYLPENTEFLEVSFLRFNGSTPVLIDFDVNVERQNPVIITPYISNWNMLSAKQSRKDFTGVTVEVTAPFEIIGLARDLFIKIVEEKGVYARIGLNIYRRRPRSNDYDLLREMEFDMLTYEESDDSVSMAVIKNDLQEILKTGKSTKYDIPVSSITDAKKWNYRDRMKLLNNINYTLPITESFIDSPTMFRSDMYLPMSNSNAEIVKSSSNINMIFKDQAFASALDAQEFFFKPGKDLTVKLRLKFKMQLFIQSRVTTNPDNIYLTIYKNYSEIIWTSEGIHIPSSFHDIVEFDVDTLLNNIELEADDVLSFKCRPDHPDTSVIEVIRIKYLTSIFFDITWTGEGDNILGIDLIRPDQLLQQYLDLISRLEGKYTAIIEWDETFTPMICAAETLREFPNAVLHGSLRDFMTWMTVLGYEYSYEGRTMKYKKRDLFYKKDVIALELSNREISKLTKLSNEEVSYTSVQIGYKKEDYNQSINGKLEINAQFDYSTGFFNQTENVLSLISPYRSDSIGVEILLNKRGEKITDNSSDNDIFALQMQEDSTEFVYSEENRMTADEILLYNGSLCPRFLVERNKTIMGIITNEVSFTGTDGYRHGTIGGEDIIYSDVEISDRLFQPFNYKFNVGSHLDMPDVNTRDGVIKFTYKGVERTGFIYEIDKFFTEQEGEWILFMLT